MITEDYCSYEIAKLLKEKGFDGVCDYAYSNKGNWFEIDRSNFDEVYCLRPTHQMAMKWLREVHNKYCDISYDIDLEWYFQIVDLKETVEYGHSETKYYHSENETNFKTYKDAVEAALKYSLENLI